MKGLQLAERYYAEAVAPIIAQRFATLHERHAAGLIGYGSDVLGHDDALSRDHEWGPRCHIWLTPDDYQHYAHALHDAFQEDLPPTFMGYSTRFVVAPEIACLVPAGPGETGIHHVAITTVARHMELQLGLRALPPRTEEWLCLPEQKLLEFTRGRVFVDRVGEITAARSALAYLPDEVWRFKLHYAWQSLDWDRDVIGLCAARGDALSARLALHRTVERIIQIVFLQARRYRPNTLKWLSRELLALPDPAPSIGPQLERCLALADPQQAIPVLDEILYVLMAEQNRLGVAAPVSPSAPSRFSRGHTDFSLTPVIEAIHNSLPLALREAEIQGALDQWVGNDDILLWAEQCQKLRGLYERRSAIRRDGVGDLIV